MSESGCKVGVQKEPYPRKTVPSSCQHWRTVRIFCRFVVKVCRIIYPTTLGTDCSLVSATCAVEHELVDTFCLQPKCGEDTENALVISAPMENIFGVGSVMVSPSLEGWGYPSLEATFCRHSVARSRPRFAVWNQTLTSSRTMLVLTVRGLPPTSGAGDGLTWVPSIHQRRVNGCLAVRIHQLFHGFKPQTFLTEAAHFKGKWSRLLPRSNVTADQWPTRHSFPSLFYSLAEVWTEALQTSECWE